MFGARRDPAPGRRRRRSLPAGDRDLLEAGAHETGVAQWAFDHGQMAGHGTPTLPASHALHLPLVVASGTIGVLSVRGDDMRRFADPEQRQLLQTFANQAAVALERADSPKRARRSRRDRPSARATAARSVSHDRTPLAVITGAATGLRDAAHSMTEETRARMADTIAVEAQQLNRLVGELLDMTRLEAGALTLRREWHSLVDVVGARSYALERSFQGRRVTLDAPGPAARAARRRCSWGRAVHNLVENALQAVRPGPRRGRAARRGRRAPGSRCATTARARARREAERVFDKFYRGGAGR